MAGEIWIDPVQERVVRLAGSLQQDKDFGWGILGELDKGGWVQIDQADVGGHQWRIVHLQLKMNGRVLLEGEELRFRAGLQPVLSGARGTELQASHPDAARRFGRQRPGQPIENR